MGKGRTPCCDKSKVRRGPWSPAEDYILSNFIRDHGHRNWRALPQKAGLMRCGKSCRLRWVNYLRPDVKLGNFTTQEEQTIINMHNAIGNKWSKIASCLPGRTDNEIKNVWNTHLKKKLAKIVITDNADHSHKRNMDEARESKTSNFSAASSSCGSSSMTTSGDRLNMEKSPSNGSSNVSNDDGWSNSKTTRTNGYIADVVLPIPSVLPGFDFGFEEFLESLENDNSHVSAIPTSLGGREEVKKSLKCLENELLEQTYEYTTI